MTAEQITKLKLLVNQNSWTWNKSGVDKVGGIVMDLLKEVPLDWEITESETKGNLFMAKSKTWDPSKPTVMLNGHLDTVFKENWEMRIDGDKFFGPGTLDMKAGVLAMIEIVLALHKQGKLSNLMLLFIPDEEDGFIHIDKQISYYKKADYCFVFEEGSHIAGGIVSRDNRALVISRKALSFFEFDFIGSSSGHQAKFVRAEDRHSAILEMSRFTLELESLADYEAGTLVNTGIVSGGTSPNSIADNAYIKVDVRYGNRSEVTRFKKHLELISEPSDPTIKIKKTESLYYPAFEITEKGEQFADQLVDLTKQLELPFKLTKEFRSSGSEANWISDSNRDCVVLDGFGVVGTGDHSQNEYFLISSFDDSVRLGVEGVSLCISN